MSMMMDQDRFGQAQILDLVKRERSKALSRREWKHRLAGHGYCIRETARGDVVESLGGRVALCMIPAG